MLNLFWSTLSALEDLGTADALVKVSSDVSMNLDNSDNIAIQALLLDFSKAFDHMRPDFVLHKLLIS